VPLQGYEAAEDEDEALAICTALFDGVQRLGIVSEYARQPVTLLAVPVKPAEDGSWESVQGAAENIDSSASSYGFKPKNSIFVPKCEQEKAALQARPYEASVDELPDGLARDNKEALVAIFNLLADADSRYLNRLQMSAVFRAFNDQNTQQEALVEMPKGEWEGICRTYNQIYGIPVTVLADLYGAHLVKTNTAEKALAFLRGA